MQSNTTTVSYDTWTGGEFGTIAPDLASQGSWTGENMVVYRDGHVGPRPGLRRVPLTEAPTGEIQGLGFVPTSDADDPSMWFIIGDKVYLFRHAGSRLAVSTTGDDLDDPIPEGGFVWWKESTRQLLGKTFIVTPDGEGYKIGMTDQSLVDVPGMDGDGHGGKDIETYKDRLLYVQDGATSTRIWYSEAADYDTWPVINYFDVGASWPVGQIMEFRDGLAIFTNSGIWLLTGTLPETAVLRRVSDSLPPRNRSIVKTNDDMFYIPNTRNAPVAYSGSSGEENMLRHLENWKASVTSDVTGVQVYGNRDVLFLSSASEMLWRKNNSWTRHKFSVDVGPYMTRYYDDNAMLTDGGGPSASPQFYTLTMNLDRPAFVSDGLAAPGDDSNTPLNAWLQVPDYFSENGDEVRVRSVIVDFVAYDTGTTATNNFRVRVEGLARFRLPGTGQSVAEDTWTEPTDSSTTTGVRKRFVANVGQSSYNGGYRLKLLDVRGVKIDRIVVDVETLDRRPRS